MEEQALAAGIRERWSVSEGEGSQTGKSAPSTVSMAFLPLPTNASPQGNTHSVKTLDAMEIPSQNARSYFPSFFLGLPGQK